MKLFGKQKIFVWGPVAVLSLALVGVGIYAISNGQILSRASTPVSPSLPIRATMELRGPNCSKIAVGATFDVDVYLHVYNNYAFGGVDVDLNYSPTYLQAVKIKAESPIYSETPFAGSLVVIPNPPLVENGRIRFSYIPPTPPGFPMTGHFRLATISFKTISVTSNAAIRFNFTPGATNDSNVAEYHVPSSSASAMPTPSTVIDILDYVTNFSLEIHNPRNYGILFPVRSNIDSGWTPIPTQMAADHYKNVDELGAHSDSDGDYLLSNGIGSKETFGFSGFGPANYPPLDSSYCPLTVTKVLPTIVLKCQSNTTKCSVRATLTMDGGISYTRDLKLYYRWRWESFSPWSLPGPFTEAQINSMRITIQQLTDNQTSLGQVQVTVQYFY
jgi:hypothetical protein